MSPFDRLWYRTGHRLERRLWRYLTPEAKLRHYRLEVVVAAEGIAMLTASMRSLADAIGMTAAMMEATFDAYAHGLAKVGE